MGVIADLVVKVSTNLNDFKTGMGEVNSKVDEAGGGFGKLGAFALGAGAAAAVAVTGIVAFGVHAVDAATNAGQAAYDMSEKFGLLPGVASEWMAVGDALGISGDTIGRSFQFLDRNMEAVKLQMETSKKHVSTLAQPYKDLGINIFNANGTMKDSNTIMMEAADVFAKMPDGPEKAGLAMKLFGRSGAEMIPILNEGSAGIQKLIDQGKLTGVVMGGDAVEGAHKYFLEQQQLNESMQGLTIQIGTFLMPAMIQVTGWFLNDLIPAIRQGWSWFQEHLYPALVQVYAGFMQLIGPAIQYIKDHFNDLKPVLEAVGIVALVVLGVIVVAIGLVIAAVVLLVAGIAWLTGQIRTNANAWAADVQNFVIGGINNFRNFVAFVQAIPDNVRSAIGSTAHGMWDAIWAEFRGMLNRIVGAWNGLHFTIGGGSFMGQNIPSMTLGVPHIPYFHQGGSVPGTGDMLAMLQGGERVLNRSEAASYGMTHSRPEIHVHIDQGAYIDGPSIDILTNKIAQRLAFSTAL